MTETYTPAARVVVVASLLLAIATMTFVTASVAGASGACSATATCEGDACRMVTVSKRNCAAYVVDFTLPAAPVTWARLIGAPRRAPG